MRRRTPVVAVLAVLLALLSAPAVAAESSSTALRRLAAAAADPSCPRAALYIIPALPNVKDAGVFQLVRATYIDTVKRLAPAGAISDVLPFSTEPNRIKGGTLVHTIILLSGSCEAGKAAARALHVKLLGDVRPLFYVYAPRAKSLFGDVYMVTVGFPYLADGYGRELSAPAAPAGTNLAAQFSITWWDTPPSMIGELQAAAFKAAILKQLPAGAGVYFTTMITQGVSYRYGNHWRACAAPVSPTVAKTAGVSSKGGTVWPPGQPADVKSGRMVFNTNIHGAVFNTAAGKQTLAAFLDGLRRNTAAVFPPRSFGAMVLNGGSGLRLVNDPAYPCSCATVPAPLLVSAQGFGPYSATAAAAGAANVTWSRWRFTASPARGAAVTQEGDSPLVWWYNLAADTSYTIRVTGITSAGQEAAGSNSLVVRTGRLGAPTLAAASPTGTTAALVYLSPPTTGSAVTRYMVSACLKAAPSSCVAANGTSTHVAVAGLAAGASYTVIATAVVGSSLVPASNSLPLAMPPSGAPILLTAAATSAVTGAATAAAPGSVTFKQYTFTAQPPSGGARATSTVTNPLGGQFAGLTPATLYSVSVVGRNGAASPASNTLPFVTPAADAPLNSGTARSATVVVVSISPPSLQPAKGGTWASYDVTLCPVSGPQSVCTTQRVRSAGRRRLLAVTTVVTFSGLKANTIYNFASVAISSLSERSGLSVTGQVATPADIPPPSIKVGSITTATAVATVTPPPTNRPWASYTLTTCVKETLDCTTTTCPAVAAPNAPTNCTLSSLSMGVTYTVTASARRSDGTQSPASEPAQFTTLTYPAPSVAVTNITSVTAVATVTPPATGRPWASYSLAVCVKGTQTCTTTSCTAVAAPNSPTSCTLTKLSMGVTYTVTATARRSDGSLSKPSAAVQFTTVVYPPPTVVVSSITPTSALATVTPPATGRPWTSYTLTLCPTGTSKCTTLNCTAVAAANKPTNCSLTSLSMGVTYRLTASARRSSDGMISPESQPVQFTTPVFPAPSITVVTSSISTNTAKISVAPPATAPAGGWAKYVLTVCTVGGSCAKQNCAPVSGPATRTMCTLTGLVKNTNYTVSAVAVNGTISSQQSAEKSFKTSNQDAPTIVSVEATAFDAVSCVKAPLEGGPWAAFNCSLCQGTKCTDMQACPIGARRRRLAADTTCTSECYLPGLEASTAYKYSCVAVSANSQVVSPESNVLTFETGQAEAPEVQLDPFDPVTAQCWAPSGGPWSVCNMQLCKPAGFVRRLLFGPCASAIQVSCRFPAPPAQVAACSLAGRVEQGVPYNVESQALKADGKRASDIGSQTGLTVPLFPKPSIQDLAVISFLRWNMTIHPESSTPLVSYPAGGWSYYQIKATFTSGWKETHTCTAKRAGQVPLPTACPLTLERTGDVTFIATAFQGNPASPKATDLRSEVSDPVSGSNRRRR